MSLAAFEEFGVKTEQAPAWEPVGAVQVWGLLEGGAPAAANEHTRPFPELPRRGPRLDARLLNRLLAGADWLVVFAVAQIASLWGHGLSLTALTAAEAIVIGAAALALKAGLWLTGIYDAPPVKAGPEQAVGGLALGAIAGILLAGLAAPDARSAAALAATLPLAAIVLAGIHAAFAIWIRFAWSRAAFAETAIVVGATPAAARFIARAKIERDLDIAAIVDDRGARAPATLAGAPVAGGVEDLLAWPDLPRIDRIVIAIGCAADVRVRALVERLKIAPNRIDLLFDYEIAHAGARRLDQRGAAPLAALSGRASCAGRAMAKRAQDLILGALLLIAFAPLMALIAAAVRLDSAGPSLFKQRRHGLNNRIITIWKFRTMRLDTGNAPTEQVRPDDPRVTRLGRLLRRTSLDELPQLINVLAGDMSLVGPRPHAIDMRASERALSDIVTEYAHRHRVKPGITGWAQIHGSRGPIEAPEAVRRRVRYDLEYVAKASLWLDLWILLRTAPALLGDRKAVR